MTAVAQAYVRAGRYALFGPIAAGGMASVHFGRLLGANGFARTVAIKRMHPQLARTPELATAFGDEARIAARIKHPNVLPTLDVVQEGEELLIVMEYVHGETLSALMRACARRGEAVPPPVALAIACDVLHGLHAAHEATDERGEPMGLVHRDVSPQNVLVGSDGVARVLDFGVAKARGRMQPSTRTGQLKGKLAYMAPEQVLGAEVTRRTDVYATAVVLWETLTGKRLFEKDNAGGIVHEIVDAILDPPSRFVPDLPPAIDRAIMRSLERNPAARFATARDLAMALEQAPRVARPSDVSAWIQQLAGDGLAERASLVKAIEATPLGEPAAAIAGLLPSEERTMTEGAAVVSSRPPPAPSRRRRPAIWLVGAVAAAAVAAASVHAFAPARGPTPSAGAGDPGAAASCAPSAAPAACAAPPPSTESPPPISPAGSLAPIASTASGATPPRIAPPNVARTRAALPRPSAAGSSPPAPPARGDRCDPPYVEDAEGIRHPRPGCY